MKAVNGRKTREFRVNLLRLFLKIWNLITLSSNAYTELQSIFLRVEPVLESLQLEEQLSSPSTWSVIKPLEQH